MSLTAKLAERNNKSQSPASNGTVMYTVEGAMFQERCLNKVNDKSYSKLIGQLVTLINNKEITVAEAEERFFNAKN